MYIGIKVFGYYLQCAPKHAFSLNHAYKIDAFCVEIGRSGVDIQSMIIIRRKDDEGSKK